MFLEGRVEGQDKINLLLVAFPHLLGKKLLQQKNYILSFVNDKNLKKTLWNSLIKLILNFSFKSA